MAGVCAVDLAGVTEFVVFEHLAVVVEMVGEVNVVVIPEGECIEGTKFFGELEHAVVFSTMPGSRVVVEIRAHLS